MAVVQFFSEDISFALAKPRKTINWIKLIAKKEKREVLDISYIFCSDTYLLQLNQQYLKHHTLTDIITFDYSEGAKQLEGEIYISIDRVKENAKKFKVSFQDELDRVIIHGVLHLIGYKDKRRTDKTLMRKKEEGCLSLRK